MTGLVDRMLGAALSLSSRNMAWMKRFPGVKDWFARHMTSAHVAVYRRTEGRHGGLPGAPSLLLTTTGRKSGQPRTIAIFYLPDGHRQILVASYGGDDRHPQWYRNLVANPVASVQIGADVRTVRARHASDEEREDLWPRLLENWPSYDDYQARTSRVLPVVILEAAR